VVADRSSAEPSGSPPGAAAPGVPSSPPPLPPEEQVPAGVGGPAAASAPEPVPASAPEPAPAPSTARPEPAATTPPSPQGASPEAPPQSEPPPQPEAPAQSEAPPRTASPAAPTSVTADDVSVDFGDVHALSNVSLGVPTGSILGVVGPSGAGKTTLIRLFTGALRPTKGHVRVLDEDPRKFRRSTREKIGYVPQLFTLYPDLTAGENVDFVASLYGLLWFRRRRRVREVLKLVDLWDARGRRASKLSGGMQRRLELACALVHEPTLLFLDEPTAGLDPILRGRVWEELRHLRDTGRTLLVTTQYVNEAEECDQIALIGEGELIALASPDEMRKRAFGGDLLEVETKSAFDGRVLGRLDVVRAVSQAGPTTMRVIVDDVGAATPIVVDGVAEAGAEVDSAREVRASFDEVFAALVAEHRRRKVAESPIEDADGREAA
jgi:ABC-2 type transport system ATP-binding protein